MIRENLPDYLKEYYKDIYPESIPESEILEVKNYFLFTTTLYKLQDRYQINGKNSPIYVYYFSIGKKAPTVNCTDILGGVMKWNEEKKKAETDYPIAFLNAICCCLLKRWNAFTICTNNKGMFEDGTTPNNFELALKNVAYNNIEGLKFIKTLPTTDCDKIYAIGVSLGALTMSAVTGIEDSYKKTVVILGGYPLDEIIATTDEGMVTEFYDRMKILYGDLARERIAEAIKNSNEVYKYIPKNTTFVIGMSKGDTSILPELQKKLIYLVEPKEVLLLPYYNWLAKLIPVFSNGHYQTLLFYPYLIYRSIKYLTKD